MWWAASLSLDCTALTCQRAAPGQRVLSLCQRFHVGQCVLAAGQVAGEHADRADCHGGVRGRGLGGVQDGQGHGRARAVGEVGGLGKVAQELAGGSAIAVPQFDAGKHDAGLMRGVPQVAGGGGTQLSAGGGQVAGLARQLGQCPGGPRPEPGGPEATTAQ